MIIPYILDSEKSYDYINLTIMCILFLFLCLSSFGKTKLY